MPKPKGEPRKTIGINLPVRYWLWLKVQPEPMRALIMRLIEQEMRRIKEIRDRE
jgi:hypothetical protein